MVLGSALGAILVLGGVTLLGLVAAIYNRLIFLKNQCEKSWHNIDVLLKQRHDEIPKLVAVCEGSTRFEKETLQKVMEARASAMGAPTVAAKARAEGELSSLLGRLFAVAEAYPELKSIQLFSQLQLRVSDLEGQISDRREFYNDAATTYNTGIETFPNNLLTGPFGMKRRELFKVAEAEKADVQIKFN